MFDQIECDYHVFNFDIFWKTQNVTLFKMVNIRNLQHYRIEKGFNGTMAPLNRGSLEIFRKKPVAAEAFLALLETTRSLLISPIFHLNCFCLKYIFYPNYIFYRKYIFYLKYFFVIIKSNSLTNGKGAGSRMKGILSNWVLPI